MPYRDETYDLQFQVHASNHVISARERELLETGLDALARLVSCFPAAKLHVHVNRHLRSNDLHVKTSLHLPGRTLFTGERDWQLYPAFERCVRKLVSKVKAYREKLGNKPALEKTAQGTRHDLWPDVEPDAARLMRAARESDYAAFREVLVVYDDALNARVGRWIQRYPQAEVVLGRDVVLSEIVEEVYSNAFERFLDRPADRLGNWLENLIEPSIRALLEHTEEEKENLEYLETLKPTEA